MTKPANFPERKRQRQIRALFRLGLNTAGKPEKGIAPKSNAMAIAALKAAIDAGDQTSKFTKKDRSARGRFMRAS
jgi:hypothetical protein